MSDPYDPEYISLSKERSVFTWYSLGYVEKLKADHLAAIAEKDKEIEKLKDERDGYKNGQMQLQDINCRLFMANNKMGGDIKRLKYLLVELDSVIRTTHLDMGGQHKYALVGGKRVGIAIGMLKEELALEEDSDATSSHSPAPK